MKIVTLCFGKNFCEKYSQKIKKYAPKNIELIVLTDKPEYFKFCKTELYKDKIFSYFSKNTFTSEISTKYKTDVLYIDADSFHIVDESIYNNQFETTYFLYDKLWPQFAYSKINSLPKDLLDYYGIK